MLVKDRQTDGRTDSTITVYLGSSALGITMFLAYLEEDRPCCAIKLLGLAQNSPANSAIKRRLV